MTGMFSFFMSSVQRKLLVGFSLVLIILLALSVVTYIQLDRVRNYSEDVVPISRQVNSQQQYTITLADLETDLERYLLTRSPQIADVLRDDIERLDQALSGLEVNAVSIRDEVSALRSLYVFMVSDIEGLLSDDGTLTAREQNQLIISAYEQIDLSKSLYGDMAQGTLDVLRDSSEKQQDIINDLV